MHTNNNIHRNIRILCTFYYNIYWNCLTLSTNKMDMMHMNDHFTEKYTCIIHIRHNYCIPYIHEESAPCIYIPIIFIWCILWMILLIYEKQYNISKLQFIWSDFFKWIIISILLNVLIYICICIIRTWYYSIFNFIIYSIWYFFVNKSIYENEKD